MITIFLGGSILDRSNWSNVFYDSFLCRCLFCGKHVITTSIRRCPFCDSSNIKAFPVSEHKCFNFNYLENNGFPFLRKLIGGEKELLTEFEIRNIIELERKHLESVVDPQEKKCLGAFIAGLECVINE